MPLISSQLFYIKYYIYFRLEIFVVTCPIISTYCVYLFYFFVPSFVWLLFCSLWYIIWVWNWLLHCFLERLALIRQQRAEAAKKREEEKAGNVLNLYVFSVLSSRLMNMKRRCNMYVSYPHLLLCFQPKTKRRPKPKNKSVWHSGNDSMKLIAPLICTV